MTEYLDNLLALALDSSPWLLLGLLAAGLIKAWLPVERVGSVLGGYGIRPVLKAALLGAPLPLCSCSTLPAALALRRSGASRASTTSFLITTPETGVDSVALTWVLLGPQMAIIRPLSAIVSGVVAGLMVGRTEQADGMPQEPAPSSESCAGGCCGTQVSEATADGIAAQGVMGRSLAGLRYAFSDLLDDIALWLLGGLLAAALVITLAPPNLLSEWGSGPLAMLLILLISVPMYVCATASTPLAHAMLFAGVSPGTVLVFLLAGPASNLASLVLVKRELGGRALAAYLTGVAGVSMLLGMGLDSLVDLWQLDLSAGLAHVGSDASELPVPLSMVCLLILVAMSVRPLRRYLLADRSQRDSSCCGG